MARVGVGLAINQAKLALTAVLDGCENVDTVVGGGPRELPKTRRNVYLQSTLSITPLASRGGLSMETFDLRFMVEAVVPWARVNPASGQPAADAVQLEQVKALRWTMADEIAAAVATNHRQLHTISADVIVTSEDAGYVDSQWVARAWCLIRCANGPVV